MTNVKLFQGDSLEGLQDKINEWVEKESVILNSVSSITSETYGIGTLYSIAVLYTEYRTLNEQES